jgi:hypothetical protein
MCLILGIGSSCLGVSWTGIQHAPVRLSRQDHRREASAAARTGWHKLTYFSGTSDARNLAPSGEADMSREQEAPLPDGSPRHEQGVAPT